MPAQPCKTPQPDPDVTGLVLCGGRGQRMGGADKGLLTLRGVPLALAVAKSLSSQAGAVWLSANRNLEIYRQFGYPVYPDELDCLSGSGAKKAFQPGDLGPLGGILSGLTHCETPYLACVPCDTPYFPASLVCKLREALDLSGQAIAVASTRSAAPASEGAGPAEPGSTPTWQSHWTICLLKVNAKQQADQPGGLASHLRANLEAGERRVGGWMSQVGFTTVRFEEAAAFENANSPPALAALQRL